MLSEVTPSYYSKLDIDDITQITLTNRVYGCLAKLYSEWKSYIVPETVTLVQIEESTSLIDVIINLAYNQPINQIAIQLSNILKTGLDDTGQTTQYLEATSYLETQFHSICNEDLAGIMLLRMINSMFAEITAALESLVLSFGKLPVPSHWNSTIFEAKELIRNKTFEPRILRAVMFLRQLEAIASFLTLVRANAVAFLSQEQNSVSPKLHSEEELTKPIKVFIATFIQDILLGVPSYAMGRVSCVLLELGLDTQITQTIDFTAEVATELGQVYNTRPLLKN